MKGCCILTNVFSASIEIIMSFLAFCLFLWFITFLILNIKPNLYCWDIIIWLWYQDIAGLIERFRKYSLIFFGREILALILFKMFARTHQWSCLFLEYFMLRGFDNWFCLFTYYMSIDMFFFLESVWVICVLLGDCLFYVGHLICWCIVVYSIL